MTTRTRILLLALAVLALLTCACDDVAEWVTGDNGANRGHYRQTGQAEDNAIPGYATATPPVEVAER